MQIEVGSILEGKVTGITKFGAFVDLPEGKSGMVHISEISNTYVENVSDFLTVGQEVKVKVITINENGKIGLSIKKLAENGKSDDHVGRGADRGDRNDRGDRRERQNNGNGRGRREGGRREDRRPPAQNMKSQNSPGDYVWQKSAAPTSFEDMMTKFKQQSDEKISSLKKSGDVIPRRPRRK